MTGCVGVYTPEDYCCGCSECSCEPVDNSENRLYNNNIINDVCGIARPAAVGTRFAPRFAKHGSKSGKQREMKMAVQYEDNILPDLKPFLDENLRLTAIPANRTVIIPNPKSMTFLMIGPVFTTRRLCGASSLTRDLWTERPIVRVTARRKRFRRLPSLLQNSYDLIPLPNRTGNYFTRSFFESIRMNSSTAALFAL